VSLLGRTAVAFAVAALGTWVAAWTARRLGLIDRPGPRKIHASPVPLGGGLGVAVGLTAGLVGAGDEALLLLPSAWALVALGLVDDARDLRARTRLALQTAAVLPVLPAYAPALGLARPLEAALALLFALGVINALKCLDCADGVAGAVAMAAAAALGSLVGWHGGSAPVAAALAGAAGGFLILNRPPARCFLGEGGSTLLGLLLATLGLATVQSAPQAGRPAMATAVATVLAVPVLDFILVHARRYRAGTRSLRDLMASAGTDHLPHRLRSFGLGPRGVAATCAAAAATSGVVAHLALRGGLSGAAIGAVLVGAALLGGERALSTVRSPVRTRRGRLPEPAPAHKGARTPSPGHRAMEEA
jgi:UDP-GlcNAc:undecaprenyl-phosphate GlcNAc-1-phosphate transferase